MCTSPRGDERHAVARTELRELASRAPSSPVAQQLDRDPQLLPGKRAASQLELLGAAAREPGSHRM